MWRWKGESGFGVENAGKRMRIENRMLDLWFGLNLKDGGARRGECLRSSWRKRIVWTYVIWQPLDVLHNSGLMESNSWKYEETFPEFFADIIKWAKFYVALKDVF